MARSLVEVESLPVLLMIGRRGAIGVSTPDVSQSTASSSSLSLVFQVGMLSHFWINGEALLLHFMLTMVHGH